MKITKRELIRQTSIIDVTVEMDGVEFRFQVELYESPECKPFISGIYYLERWEKPLKNSIKKQIRTFIKQSIEDEHNRNAI